ncbi:MAG: DinB family protein [Candidatus Latescibacteria bacterium]|nr:DinB family protein [Candidatus Latescibacterota bacterium]
MYTMRPQASEYNAYYGGYIEQVPEGDILSILRSQIVESTMLLERAKPERVEYRYAPGKWTLHEVVGHVVDMEWVFTVRALSFARGMEAPMPGVEQEDFVKVANFAPQSWPALIAQWRALRAANTILFETFDDAAWTRKGIASDNPVSVRALAYIVAGHERHHMGIIRERYLG